MTNNPPIPFLDLVTPHKELEKELCDVFRTALNTAGFIGGRVVEDFEKQFAAFCDAEYCVGVSSGTDALRFALMAAGVKAGDIVITVPNTFIATVEAISQAGASPAFVDVDERTYNIDVRRVKQYLQEECHFDADAGATIHRKTGRRVAAIVPVHLYGQMADMDPLLDVADRYGLLVIEDACQAHGAQYFSKKDQRWHKAGSMGVAAAFSFYPGKNLGACGEAGAATTNDAEVAKKMRMLRDHGQARKYYHDLEGYNGRLDAIQAGILGIKLQHLAEWNERRRTNAGRYGELFGPSPDSVILPHEPAWSKGVYHLYVIRVDSRDELQRYLAEDGIGTGIHYPVPLHQQKAYAELGYKDGDFPVSERVAADIVSLPMFPGLEARDQERVVRQVIAFSRARAQKVALAAGTGSY